MAKDREISTRPRIIRLIRSIHSKHHHRSKVTNLSAGVIHATIRTPQSTSHPSNIHQTISGNSSKCLSNKTYSANTNKIHSNDQTSSSSFQSSLNDDNIHRQLSGYNTYTNSENTMGYHYDHSNITMNNISSDQMGLTDDYHRKQDNKTKKKTFFGLCQCSCLCIILSIFLILILIITIVVILIALLYPSTKTTVKYDAPLRWKTTGKTIAGIVGKSGNGSNQLKYPWSLAIDSLYTLYIGDRQNHRIQKYQMPISNGTTIAGRVDGILGSNATGLWFPAYIHVDINGNLYIPDTSNHRIQFWSHGASQGITVAGTSGLSGNLSNQLFSPFGVTRDANTGTLYIADSSNNRIVSYSSGASSGTIIAGNNGQGTSNTQLFYPRAIYLDSSTNSLVIVNRGANNVIRWVLGETSWTLVAGSINGTLGNSSERFRQPGDVTFDVLGNMYVSDDQNHRIQFFPFGQSIGITIAGVTGVMGNDSEHLTYPSSVIVDNQLNLYVCDQSNHRIQLFERY